MRDLATHIRLASEAGWLVNTSRVWYVAGMRSEDTALDEDTALADAPTTGWVRLVPAGLQIQTDDPELFQIVSPDMLVAASNLYLAIRDAQSVLGEGTP